MKIVYLHQYFNTPAMNGGTRSYEMARRLVANGHHVSLITSDRQNGGKSRVEYEDGIEVTWIPVAYSNQMGPVARLRAFLSFAAKSSWHVVRCDCDVIFATSTPLTIAIPAIVGKWIRRRPMVFEVRDPWPDMLIGMGALRNPLFKRMAHAFEAFAYRRSDRIIALSNGMKDIIVSTGYPPERVAVIPNSSDIEAFDVPARARSDFRRRYDWLGDRKLVLYAGTIGLANGVDYLVRVAGETLLLDDQVRFLVIGDGAQRERVRELAHDLGVLNVNFYMLPPMSKSEIPAAFAAADVSLVLLRDVPELWTNSSNKFFDGLAAGRPVVVNNVGWQSKLLEETGAGFDIHPVDFTLASRTLYRYLMDDDWLYTARAASAQLAKTRFHREDLARDFRQVLEEAAEAKLNGRGMAHGEKLRGGGDRP